MRAPDLGYAPRFLSSFWLVRNPVSRANPPSHPKRVTRTVGRREENTEGSLEGKVEWLQHHAHHAPPECKQKVLQVIGAARRVLRGTTSFLLLVCNCSAMVSVVQKADRQGQWFPRSCLFSSAANAW